MVINIFLKLRMVKLFNVTGPQGALEIDYALEDENIHLMQRN